MFIHVWRHIRRSPYQALAAVSNMTLTFIVVGLFVLISLASVIVLQTFEQRPQIIVFFNDTKKETEILKLKEKLEQMAQVSQVKYISQEEALTIYKEEFKNDPLLLEMVSADILPASIEISAHKIDDLNYLAKSLQKETGIEEIAYPKDVVEFLAAWNKAIRKIGFSLVIFLTMVSIFTLVTVIAMKIALKKEEIEILQLVGATPGYVRMPFVVEGVIYGLVGSLIGTMVNLGLLVYFNPFLSRLFGGFGLFPISYWFYLSFAGAMVAFGASFGFLASMLAINRYLTK